MLASRFWLGIVGNLIPTVALFVLLLLRSRALGQSAPVSPDQPWHASDERKIEADAKHLRDSRLTSNRARLIRWLSWSIWRPDECEQTTIRNYFRSAATMQRRSYCRVLSHTRRFRSSPLSGSPRVDSSVQIRTLLLILLSTDQPSRHKFPSTK